MKKIFLVLGLLVVLFGCSEQEEVKNLEAGIPSYKIEKKDFMKPIKASFDVRLENKITEKEIQIIANKIKSENAGYDKYFILYYLPDMKIGAGAWATSNFNPDLEIKILGLTLEEENKTKNPSLMPTGKIVGKWLHEMHNNTTVIFNEDNKFKMRQLFKDGSFGDKDLVKKDDNIYTYQNDFGEYVKIENDGSLSWYSENGKFATLQKID
ncbi:MAG: hypothetical protein KAT32_00240 [Candidatus Moranbacteria bacterium]|nr:hypothetical protein [Candidatus Moranbacteria bacterium]